MRNIDWRQEWKDEQTLTPEELKEKAQEEAEERAYYEDQLLLVKELQQEEHRRELERDRYLYLDDQIDDEDYPL